MLVDKLLFPLGIKYYGEVVETRYRAAKLEAVYEKKCELLLAAPRLIQEYILQILNFCQLLYVLSVYTCQMVSGRLFLTARRLTGFIIASACQTDTL